MRPHRAAAGLLTIRFAAASACVELGSKFSSSRPMNMEKMMIVTVESLQLGGLAGLTALTMGLGQERSEMEKR